MVINMYITKPTGCCIAFVMDDGGWNVSAFPAGQLRSEIQIGVFVIEKKIIIQKSDLVEHPATIKNRCSACAENEFRIAKRVSGGPRSAPELTILES